MYRLLPLTTLLASGLALANPTNLPFEETFGNTTTSCDAAWDGDCEVGWYGYGEDDSLKVVQRLAGTLDYGVQIHPGTTTPNGILRTFAVDDTYAAMAYSLAAWTGNGTADVQVRAIFKDSAGVILSTQTITTSVGCEETTEPLKGEFLIPSGAVKASFFVGAHNGTGEDPEVQLVVSGAFTFFIWVTSIAGDACPDASCSAGDDYSCDEGMRKACLCDKGSPPECTVIDECWCEDASEDECAWGN